MLFIFRAIRWAWSKRRLAGIQRKTAARQLAVERALSERPWAYLDSTLDQQWLALLESGQISDEESRAAWQKIRSSCFLEWQNLVETARREVAAQKTLLVELGKKIQESQRELAQAQKKFSEAEPMDLGWEVCQVQEKLAQAQRLLTQTEAAKPLTQADDLRTYDAEFAKLCDLPGIRAVRVSEAAVEIVTKPVIVTIKGRYYDLGDYHVIISTLVRDRHFPKVWCVFSTNQNGGSFDAHLYGGYGSFCFGSRSPLLDRVLRQGEYLAAVILVLEALHHINSQDKSEASRVYPEIVFPEADKETAWTT